MTRSVELKLYAYRKNRDGLIISFVVHPNDEQQLLGIDIGDTFDAVLTESDGARDPVSPPEKPAFPQGPAPSDGNRWNAKFMALCKDPEFQRWLGIPENHVGNNYGLEWAVEELKDNRIEIGSRSELATNPEAQKRFLLLEAQYHAERRGG
jgi:hypothetical protein